MSPRPRRPGFRARRFPRVSGDEPGTVLAVINIDPFSPRERG